MKIYIVKADFMTEDGELVMPDIVSELIQCKDCIYYDPPHIENDGQRYEYKDMPPEAFDPITKKYVSVAYGINMGGRCCRDYECGYSEDKRVFVTETNYCGRAEQRGEE